MDAERALTGVEQASQPYVGEWNRLVSTTNWEKGRIIAEWRHALQKSDAPVSEFSDEAWARRVGCITSQHVGRLRRVWDRFGARYETYEGLYWSHFQAAVEWDDAEMWLEGAVQNGWSVSEMRRSRWETLGRIGGIDPALEETITGELDEDFETAGGRSPEILSLAENAITPELADVRHTDAESPSARSGDSAGGETRPRREKSDDEVEEGAETAAARPRVAAPDPVRPFVELPQLPDDVAEAFESFKLAILRHKGTGWKGISRDDLLASLDALKELALAPSGDESEAPF
jgi:hypothetical protein